MDWSRDTGGDQDVCGQTAQPMPHRDLGVWGGKAVVKLSVAAQLVLALGESEARHLDSSDLDVDHLVIGFLKAADVQARPEGIAEADWDQARREIEALAGHWRRARVNPVQMRRRLRFLVARQKPGSARYSGGRSQRCQQVLDRASELAGGGEIGLVTLLGACLEQKNDATDQVFQEFATDKAALVPGEEQLREDEQPAQRAHVREGVRFEESRLAKYGRDLTALAKAGKLDPVIGRREEMKDLARILNQAIRNNAMLVGEAGVGKTAVVEGLAQYAAQPDAHESVRNYHFIEVTLVSLIAGGGSAAGGRLLEVLKAAEDDPDLVLFFDEFHALAAAADLLKPTLAQGKVHCIGATTIAEYHKHIEGDHALARRFQRVWIGEPSRDETVQILQGLRGKLQQRHGLQITDEAIEATVDFTIRHVADGRLPDKAIILLDQACAQTRIKTFSPVAGPAPTSLTVEDIAEVVAKQTRLPVNRILATATNRVTRLNASLEEVEKSLGSRVIGQDLAVATLARALQRIDTGLEQEGKPFVVMFAGPSGTGKTELAKALSALMFGDEDRLITLDMTRFRERHERAELFGSPPGYVDSDRVPKLVQDIEAQPNSVVLLDEIEKAHPEVMTGLMPVFDEGRLETAMGRVADFTHAIIALTSNLGTGHKEARLGPDIGEVLPAGEREQRKAKQFEYQIRQAISRSIRPELLNRIDATVVFQPLTHGALYRILDLDLGKLNRRRGLAQRGIEVMLDDAAKDFVIERSHTAEFGARELMRQLDYWVTNPLSDSLSAGTFATGARVMCRRAGDALEFVAAEAGASTAGSLRSGIQSGG